MLKWQTVFLSIWTIITIGSIYLFPGHFNILQVACLLLVEYLYTGVLIFFIVQIPQVIWDWLPELIRSYKREL